MRWRVAATVTRKTRRKRLADLIGKADVLDRRVDGVECEVDTEPMARLVAGALIELGCTVVKVQRWVPGRWETMI